jgi:hypothetical protein
MTEPQPRPARDQVDDLKGHGFTVPQAFAIAGLRWYGPKAATWDDLEHEIRETAHEEVRPR